MRDWKEWVKAAGIRAVKTMAQAACSFITVGMTVSEINWEYVASVTVVAGVYSIVTSLVGLPEVTTYNLKDPDLQDDEYNEVEDVEDEGVDE